MSKRDVVIVGGGFAGINLARRLAHEKRVRVTLIDCNNYNFFQPLLYQVATGLLDVSSIALPFRTIFKDVDNIRFRLGTVERVDVESRTVHLSTGVVEYDLLILATGTRTNFFGMDGVEERAHPMKTVEEALDLRNHLLRRTEEATYTADSEERARLLTVVISGAGPTGVELAGMLAEMRSELLERIYPELDPNEIDVVLLDAAPTVLPPMRAESRRYTHETLRQMDVRVLLDARVEDYREGAVRLAGGESIPAATLVWAAGVTGSVIDGLPDTSYAKGNPATTDGLVWEQD
jgi:NADH dehydrogenase